MSRGSSRFERTCAFFKLQINISVKNYNNYNEVQVD